MYSKFDDEKTFAELLGPGSVDKMLRDTMSMCWMSLPASERTIDKLENEMKRLLERAITNWREDEELRPKHKTQSE